MLRALSPPACQIARCVTTSCDRFHGSDPHRSAFGAFVPVIDDTICEPGLPEFVSCEAER